MLPSFLSSHWLVTASQEKNEHLPSNIHSISQAFADSTLIIVLTTPSPEKATPESQLPENGHKKLGLSEAEMIQALFLSQA